eukprot:62326-Rhodomonas_salina.1
MPHTKRAPAQEADWPVRCVEEGLRAHGWRVDAVREGQDITEAELEVVVDESEEEEEEERGGEDEGARAWIVRRGGEGECVWVKAHRGDTGWRVCTRGGGQ